MRNKLFLFVFLFAVLAIVDSHAFERKKYNFNSEWRLQIGDFPEAKQSQFDDSRWKAVTLPHAFNEDEAFKVSIEQLTDTVVWYRKHFRIPASGKKQKVFIEFEGVRQAGDFYLNGQYLGKHENGVMAAGFDLTPYIKEGDNVLAVRTDNDWMYREKSTNSKFQWNDRNFNANYGGLPKNVFLYVTDEVYQTLPLYSNLKTTGVYIYAKDIDVKGRTATIHAESEVKNDSREPRQFSYQVVLLDADGKQVKSFEGEKVTLQGGETRVVKAASKVNNLHFWSWGYGYLYTVQTILKDNKNQVFDEVSTRTGFRKTRFAEGKIWLNDRVIQMKGYAQRTSNEWPAVGLSVPAWLSDYSNGLVVKGNGNLVRWMHVTPWKQDVESCDRVGLIQAIHGKFCDTCNRIRVTADGRLMPCLGSSVTMDLVPDSWNFADDVEKDFAIVRALRAAIKAKPRCHNFNDNAVTYTKTTETKTTEIEAAEVNAARNMSRIGG
jgi:beta-galactosidase